MKCPRVTVISASAMMLGLALSSGASAQSTWNLFKGSAANRQGLASGCSATGANPGSFNNSYNCTVATTPTGQSVTVSAWSANADRGAPGGVKGTVNVTNSDPTKATSTSSYYGQSYALSGSGFASAMISDQGNSGFGGTSRFEAQSARAAGNLSPLNPASPDHSFDSIIPGSYDMMLLDFGVGKSRILDQIGIGWTNGNADITLLRWTGSSAPTGTPGSSTMSGDGHANLSDAMYNSATPGTAGWQLVNSYADLTVDNTPAFGSATGAARNTGATQASSWWLISAFNTALNGNKTSCLKSTGATTTCSATNNGFKLNYIATSFAPPPPPPAAPEPGSLALAGVALAGVFASRRRLAKRA